MSCNESKMLLQVKFFGKLWFSLEHFTHCDFTFELKWCWTRVAYTFDFIALYPPPTEYLYSVFLWSKQLLPNLSTTQSLWSGGADFEKHFNNLNLHKQASEKQWIISLLILLILFRFAQWVEVTCVAVKCQQALNCS